MFRRGGEVGSAGLPSDGHKEDWVRESAEDRCTAVWRGGRVRNREGAGPA